MTRNGSSVRSSLLSLAAAALACGGTPSPGGSSNDPCTGSFAPSSLSTISCSCNGSAAFGTTGGCGDFGQALASAVCTGSGGIAASCSGTGAAAACPSANRVGTCFKGASAFRYFSPQYTTATAQADCTGNNSGFCFVAN